MPQVAPIPPRALSPQQPVPPFQGPPVNPLVPGRRLSPSLGNRLPLPSAGEGVQQPPQPQQYREARRRGGLRAHPSRRGCHAEIGRAHVCTPVTSLSPMPSSASKKKNN